jgi:hypothetical protein
MDETRINWNNETSDVRVYQQTDNTITMTNGEKSITSDTWYDVKNMR